MLLRVKKTNPLSNDFKICVYNKSNALRPMPFKAEVEKFLVQKREINLNTKSAMKEAFP